MLFFIKFTGLMIVLELLGIDTSPLLSLPWYAYAGFLLIWIFDIAAHLD